MLAAGRLLLGVQRGAASKRSAAVSPAALHACLNCLMSQFRVTNAGESSLRASAAGTGTAQRVGGRTAASQQVCAIWLKTQLTA